MFLRFVNLYVYSMKMKTTDIYRTIRSIYPSIVKSPDGAGIYIPRDGFLVLFNFILLSFRFLPISTMNMNTRAETYSG